MEPIDKNDLLFMQLISLFQFAALQQMGKVKNPITDKIERDLAQAQSSIDMLEMIYAKTKSNLSNDEDRMLSTILQELRLNFVDESSKPAPAGQN